MAFETIRGESGVDFIGSDAVDVLFALNETGAITADGKGGNDTITLSDSDNVVGTATIRGGAGNDTIGLTDQDGTGRNARLSNSSVNGGSGDDDLFLAGTVQSVVRGNEDNDDFFLRGNYTNSTINGNKGVDSFTLLGAITLSNTKILGGADNDGAMNFNATVISAAVDSTINGSAGVDNIAIGNVVNANNFTVFGGQGNDVITSTNADFTVGGVTTEVADNVVYSGDNGDDTITTAGAKASILGGEGDDVITSGADMDTIDGGEGGDTINAGAEGDSITGGAGNDTIISGLGNDTINAGAGADTITVDGAETNVYVYSSVSDSAATITGKTDGFDTLTGADFGATEKVDLTAVATSLVGDSIASTDQVQGGAAIAVTGVNSFANLRTFLNNAGSLVASGAAGPGAGRISLQTITVTGGDIAGTYFIANNANTLLDSGDMMWESTTVTQAGLEAAIEAGF